VVLEDDKPLICSYVPAPAPRIEGVSTKAPIIVAGMGEGPAPGPGNHHKNAEEKRESPASISVSTSGGVSEAPMTGMPPPIPRNVIHDICNSLVGRKPRQDAWLRTRS
jgi:hypothetical protein